MGEHRNSLRGASGKGNKRHRERKFKEEIGARERTRTSTTLRSLAPEASASASSATRARVKRVDPEESQPFARHFQFCPRPSPLSTRVKFTRNGSKIAVQTDLEESCGSSKER